MCIRDSNQRGCFFIETLCIEPGRTARSLKIRQVLSRATNFELSTVWHVRTCLSMSSNLPLFEPEESGTPSFRPITCMVPLAHHQCRKRHLDQFRRFCRAHQCASTQRPTGRQTETSMAAIAGRIRHYGSTLCFKKRPPFYFCHNFVRCRPIFIILSLADSSGNLQ